MADKTEDTAMVEEPLTEKPKAEPEKQEAKVEPEPKVDPGQVQAELEKTREALKKANKEAAERRKRLEELEAAETKRKEAEMTEAEKLQAQIKQLTDEKAQLENRQKEFERRELQRKVALAVGLPEGIAERLKGDTEEDMTTDAKALLDLLPKQEVTPKPKAPALPVTNPGNSAVNETIAQKKERLGMARSVNTWDLNFVKQHGGGVGTTIEE